MQLELLSYPSQNPAYSERPPLLFVHGAFHTAECWEYHFLPFFAAHGYSAYALSLRGHGKSEGRDQLGRAKIDDYIEDVRQVAVTLPAPPILIGHSMGGFISRKYLECYPVRALVLLASGPPRFNYLNIILHASRHPRISLALLRFERPTISLPMHIMKKAFFSALSPSELNKVSRLLQTESSQALREVMSGKLTMDIQVPVLVIGGMKDVLLPVESILATARAYSTSALLFDSGHDLMLDAARTQVASHILTWLQTTF